MTETQNADGSFVRTMRLDQACNQHHGHSHDVDHYMVVETGVAEVTVCQPDDRRIPINGVVLRPGDEPFLVKAELWHTWKALEPNTIVVCTFPNGERLTFTSEDSNGR